MGRAGRVSAGVCYRLYTAEAYRDLADEDELEIRRCNLSGLVLNMVTYGFGCGSDRAADICKFDFMDRPSKESLASTLEELYALSALDD